MREFPGSSPWVIVLTLQLLVLAAVVATWIPSSSANCRPVLRGAVPAAPAVEIPWGLGS